jgi:sugar lactone lactonase YvrE
LFVSSHNSDLIIEVDLDDGTRTLISDNDSYGGDVDFNLPLYMEYDSVNDRVLVTDSYLIAVDVNTGTRTKLGTSYGELDGIGFNSATNQVYAVRRARGLQKFDIPNDTNETISDNTIATATSDTEFGDIWGLEMNFDDGLAYISDWSANSIIEVDLATGARTTLADNSKPDANNTFISPVEFSWDATNDRMFVLDSGRGSIIEVDYNSGVRTVISSATVPNRVNAFRTPSDIALDLPNNRAFVLDTGYGAVIEVALDTGARTIIGTLSGTFAKQYYAFDFDSVNDRLLLVNRYDGLVEMDLSGNTNTIVDKDFRDVIFDATSEQAFVLESDTFAGRVLEIVDVDLTTGETEHVPTSVTPDKNVSLDNPFDIEIDPSNNRAFVSDLDKAAIIALDLDTGARTVLSDNTIAVGTSTMSFTLPKGITLDSQNNRLLVLDSTQDALIAVALDTGARTLISDNLTAVDTSTFDFSSPRYLVLDEANNRALVLDGSTLVAVNLSNGERTILTDNSMEGIQLSGQSDLTIDVANNRALISDLNRDTVIAVDLDNGARSIFVDDDTPVVGSDGFSKPLGITIDPLNNRIILVDWWSRTVNAADLDTAVRTRLSSSSGANSFFTFQTSSVVYDEEHDRALVVDIDRDTITAVDLVTGARVILSQ